MRVHAAIPGHPLGTRVAALFSHGPANRTPDGYGSCILIPELLGKPLREGRTEEVRVLSAFLARLDLRPLDGATARLAAVLSASYKLKAADAVHLATAVASGANRFITSNAKDFPKSIVEIEITYPDELAPAEPG